MTRISLGQYYPADSPVHRIEGRFRLLFILIFLVFSFICESVPAFVLLTVFSLFLIVLSRVPLSVILKSVKAILVILLITFLMNMFFYAGEGEPLFSWWIFTLYAEGILHAFLMSFRILTLVTVTTLLLSYTATPVDVTHSIEAAFAPVKFLKRPVHTFSMMMFIALRFVPTLADDADRIMTAQKSRGGDFSTGSLFARIKGFSAVLIPLFVSSFRRADELAVAMECRCYSGADGRTRMRTAHPGAVDFVFLVLFAAFGAGIVLLNRCSFGGIF